MFFNAKEEKTRYKYLIYYSFSFLENSAIILVWFLATRSQSPGPWYVLLLSSWLPQTLLPISIFRYVFPALVSHYLTFFAGIMFMLCYYLWFHPTGIELPYLRGRKEQRKVAGVPGQEEQEAGQELVQLAKEPEPGSRGTGGLLPRMEQELGQEATDSGGPETRVKLLVQMESSPVGKVVSQGSTGDLGAARRLKYMGQKSQEPSPSV